MTLVARWRTPGAVELTPNVVHVWSIDLAREVPAADEHEATLSPDEQARAARFHFAEDRRRFVCARGVLRAVLGEYLQASPVSIAFTYGTRGKPALAAHLSPALSFNLSHSHDVALLAVAPGHVDIGVDVERIRPVPDADAIAGSFFAPAEAARWRVAAAAEKDATFFECWTRTEACLKALGDGLGALRDRVDITPGADRLVDLRVSGDERTTRRLLLFSLTPGAGYAAALAVTPGVDRVDCWQWQRHRGRPSRDV